MSIRDEFYELTKEACEAFLNNEIDLEELSERVYECYQGYSKLYDI